MSPPRFSDRHGLGDSVEIKYRGELPEQLRRILFDILLRSFNNRVIRDKARALFNPYGIAPTTISAPKPYQDSIKEPVSEGELVAIGNSTRWYELFDLIEALYDDQVFYDENLASPDEDRAAVAFQVEVSNFFMHAGVGWKMERGRIIARGDEAFETTAAKAIAVLKQNKRDTAAQHLHEAFLDLSRRPEPDTTGAVHHAMGAAEALARSITGESKLTLGEIIKRRADLIPKPLDEALSKAWGYASNEARHISEGRGPGRKEAELIVGLVAAMITYLSSEH